MVQPRGQLAKWLNLYAHCKTDDLKVLPIASISREKLFSVEWRGHVVKRVVAAGGTEGDAEVIYDAFHEHLSRHKEKEKAKGQERRLGRSALAATRAKAKAAFARNFSQDDVVVLEKQK